MARQQQFLRPSIFSLAAGMQWDFTLREAVWLEERVGRSTNHFGGRWPIIQFFSVFQTSISRLITSGITFEQPLLNDLRAHSGVFSRLGLVGTVGLCLQRQVLRNTLHRPGWIDKEGYAGQSVIVRRGIFARRDKTHNVVYFAIGWMLLWQSHVIWYVSNLGNVMFFLDEIWTYVWYMI